MQFALMGYETQEVSDVKIAANRATPLDIVLKEGSTQLGEVVVTAKSYKAANEAGVLKIQQTAAQVSSVISAQQIGKTSDKNLGEALKRVTGISTMDNKYVVVRGMGERWNEASLDGVTLPSTEANAKAFGFDLIPTNIIDNVMVTKTVTPDMNANFAGGFVQVNTKSIPDENFFNVSVGTTWNSVSTGKTQIGRERGSTDWLGFDDGRRTFPVNLRNFGYNFLNRDHEQRIAQTYRFAEMGDNFTLYTSNTPLAANLQLSMGRTWRPESNPADRWGYVASLSYRNTQQQTVVEHQGRGSYVNWMEEMPAGESPNNAYQTEEKNAGHVYKYGTVLGGLFNGGWQRGGNKVNLRNTYTRKFDNDLSFIQGWGENEGTSVTPFQEHFNSPTFQDLLQNKVDGEHQLGKVKLRWDVAHTYVRRNETDAVDTKASSVEADGMLFWHDMVSSQVNSGTTRRHYDSSERDFNWGVSAELPFNIGDNFLTTAKFGYMGAKKSNTLRMEEAEYRSLSGTNNPDQNAVMEFYNSSISNRTNPMQMVANGYYWHVKNYGGQGNGAYEGAVDQHDPYLMFDHRWGKLVRLVWGARGEFYLYNENGNPFDDNTGVAAGLNLDNKVRDKKWSLLPSANLTVTPIENFNVRLAYSRSVVRPQFMERTNFFFYDPTLEGLTFSYGVKSTEVDAADLKLEWYPGAGEIISAGVFYRYLNDPIERMSNLIGSTMYYGLQNNDWAKNWGFEFELRKNLSFIADLDLLRNLYVYGNATITHSEVMALAQDLNNVNPETGLYEKIPVGITRPLYGQTPLIYNLGLSYESETLGANIAMNHNGRKLYLVGDYLSQSETDEYEAAATLLDAQISYTFPRAGLTLKLSGSNLLDTKSIFYRKHYSNFEEVESELTRRTYQLKPGTDENYEKTDPVTYMSRSGRSISFSASWTF